jgi:hypothetical protein
MAHRTKLCVSQVTLVSDWSEYGIREMIFRFLQDFPVISNWKTLTMCKMFPLRLLFVRFWRGRPATSHRLRHFRSAAQLPLVP